MAEIECGGRIDLALGARDTAIGLISPHDKLPAARGIERMLGEQRGTDPNPGLEGDTT